jgi:hypothetical protein
VIGGLNFEQRITSLFNVGLQIGVYVARRVRIAALGLVFSTDAQDDYSQYDGPSDVPENYNLEESDNPNLLYGAAVGYAVASTRNFVMSPSVMYLRIDEVAYGSFLGFAMPFEWVTDSGFRMGFIISGGRVFGGEVRGTCFDNGGFGPTGSTDQCEPGEVRAFNREASTGFYAHFQMGWGMNHPPPIGSATPAP